jgi:hypothetical protein
MLAVETRRTGPAARFPVRELVGALVGGDDVESFEVTERTLRTTGSRTAVFADLLHPALVEIANLWYAGRVGAADEVRAASAPACRRRRRPGPCRPARAACSPCRRATRTTWGC